MAGRRVWGLAGVVCAALLGWWVWPWFRPRWFPAQGDTVIAVLAEDPLRTEHALDLWQIDAGAELWILGAPSLQRASMEQLAARPLLADRSAAVVSLTEGSDTVDQITALARHLERRPARRGVGLLVLVSDPAHLPRAATIARLVFGARGVEVLPSASGGRPHHRPEHPWRTVRDVLRAQLWRATGRHGGAAADTLGFR